jgi:hypothetical protein
LICGLRLWAIPHFSRAVKDRLRWPVVCAIREKAYDQIAVQRIGGGAVLIEEIESEENIIRCCHSLFRRMAAEWNVNYEYHFVTD